MSKTRTTYDEKAVETCRRLYCKYAGKNFLGIEAEMRKAGYPNWSKSQLVDRSVGKKGERFGWITKYGFERSLELHTQKLVESINDDEQDLYLGIKTTRKALQEKIAGKEKTKDDLYQYRDFCKLEIDARRNLDLSRDNLETFVSGYEKLLGWLSEIDPAAAKHLVKHGERLAEMAQAHYGKAEAVDDGTGDPEDEGGNGSDAGQGPE